MSQQHMFRYQHFSIIKDQVLGHGSYGAVYKAKCDQLTCAAKVLHPTIVDPYDSGAGKILHRFQQECDFLNHIRHPHIVQYLGVCQDPESKLPVLLMELLDSSLTKMLESSPHPIPYHIQVDLCSDVSLAVAYLHSNGIIHRDLSGNNVLVIAGRRAKVTDFGMSKLSRSENNFTPLTVCPGTLGYMSPESLKEPPQYTEKLDVFSQGVLIVQVCTRQFPDPGPPVKEIDDPRSPTGSIQVPVLEPERRKNHIDMIDSTHVLLPIALDCLKYRGRDRPSAEELCQRLDILKEYLKSSQHTTSTSLEENEIECEVILKEKDREIAAKEEQILAKDRQIADFTRELSTKDELITVKDQENHSLQVQLQALNQKLTENEQVNLEHQETNKILHRQISVLHTLLKQQPPSTKDSSTEPKPTIQLEVGLKFRWRNGGKAPFSDLKQGMLVKDNVAYFSSVEKVYSFDSSTGKWDTSLPECPHRFGSLAIVQGLLTMVGGWISDDRKATNKLASLINNEKGVRWNEYLNPPMPTGRQGTTATTYQNHLIVAGGSVSLSGNYCLDTVEVLNTGTLVWSKVISLPHSFGCGSATVCGDQLYILAEFDRIGACRSVFSCSLPELLQSSNKQIQSTYRLWQRLDIPLYFSTCATVCGQLVAVGGSSDAGISKVNNKPFIYQYYPDTGTWKIISHMNIARSGCYVAVMNTDEMIVLGGYGNDGRTDDIEIGSFVETL